MELHSNITGEGEPLLILHGFLGMGDNWKTFAKQMAAENFECHLIDQRNHGRSPHSDDFDYEVMAGDIYEYCQKHNLDQVNVLGHSMGGKTAMHFACEHPKMIHKLVVADIAPKYYAPHHQTILKGLTELSKRKLKSRRKADEYLAEFISEKGVRQFLLKNLFWKNKDKDRLALRMNLSVLKDKIDNLGQGLEKDQKFEGPTFFIKGGNSDYITEEDRDLIESHFPKSQLATIKNSGHWVHAEQREAFFNLAHGFLKEN